MQHFSMHILGDGRFVGYRGEVRSRTHAPNARQADIF
jgi:hypothetical protein